MRRQAMSDTEEEGLGRSTMHRKADMLNINNFEDEFQIKTACHRKRSADFYRDRQAQI